MVYVLIIVALFGALSFVLSRQTDTSEAGVISEEQLEIYTATIQQSTMQLKQAVEQLTFTGTNINDLDFVTSDQGTFNNPPFYDKVFHPAGGGVILPRIPDDAIDEDALVGTPAARWYIGRFIDVEWSPSTADDVILTAYQLSEQVCARINEKLTGSSAIPDLVGIAATDTILLNSAGTVQFTSAHCPACYGQQSLCVRDTSTAEDNWSYYSLIAIQ